MKRIVCFLLCICLTVVYCPCATVAIENNNYEHLNIPSIVDKDGSSFEMVLPVISKDGEFYIEPQRFTEITRYGLSVGEGSIGFSLGLKMLMIYTSDQSFEVNLTKQTFSGSIMIDGVHYLPMSELLPWMNVQCYIADKKLHFDSDVISYWEVISNFKSNDYMFDLAEEYGDSTGDVIGLCAISIFDCIMDLGNIWKRIVPIDSGETSFYEYEIYNECFREFALTEVGTGAEVQRILSSISGMVSDGSQFLNTYYKALFTEEMQKRIEEVFGKEFADGVHEWPAEGVQITDTLQYAKTALKYLKTGYLYARILTEDTNNYADALRYIYLDNSLYPDGIQTAAIQAVTALESKEGAIWDATANILMDVGIEYLEKMKDEATEEALQAIAGDTILGSLGLYLNIIDAALSLVWPVNSAYEEITKMTVYQGIQYDALNAFYRIPKYRQTISVHDISCGRNSAIIFLKVAKKCFQAQQDTFDLYNGEGVLDWKISLIDDKVLEFELSSLSEERDAIVNQDEGADTLKEVWCDLISSVDIASYNKNVNIQSEKILGTWNYYKHGERSDHMSTLTLNKDGTAYSSIGIYATDACLGFSGTWEMVSADSTSCVVQLAGMAGDWGLGYEPVIEEYSEEVYLEVMDDSLYIRAINATDTYWYDQEWHVRDLSDISWQESEKTKMYSQYKNFFYNNFSNTDKVCLTDVTHDGYMDMIVIHFEDNAYIKGYVFTAIAGYVKEIYRNSGGKFHVAGYYEWYLRNEYGQAVLGEGDRTFAVPNMMARHYFQEYYLDNAGNIYEVNKIEYTPLGNLGPESEEAFAAYSLCEADAKSHFWTLHYEPGGNADDDTMGLYTMNPQIVFASD